MSDEGRHAVVSDSGRVQIVLPALLGRLVWAWAVRRCARHIARMTLDDAMLGFQACREPHCAECAALARAYPNRFRIIT